MASSIPLENSLLKVQEYDAKSSAAAHPIGSFVARCLETTGKSELAHDVALLSLVVQQFAVCSAKDIPKLKVMSKKCKVSPQRRRKAKC